MSFERLPDGMVGYATYELAEMLGRLTPHQRAAIDRIVRHVYINNQPLAALFRGDDKICPESRYYSRGTVDPDTGKRKSVGWAHRPDFVQALEQAKKLALATRERESLGRLRQAKEAAERAAAPAVQTWVNVMSSSGNDFARIDAAAKVVDLAFKGSGEQTDTGAGLEADWWAAAGDDEHE